MWFVMPGADPVFWTYRKSQKIRNLARDPRISGLVEAGDRYDTLHGVELIGTAEIVDDPGEVLAVGAELAAGYAGRGAPRDPARAAANRVAVVLRPHRTMSWDHRKIAG
jgi:Pyridoxamine 5'-phosphate oxidase